MKRLRINVPDYATGPMAFGGPAAIRPNGPLIALPYDWDELDRLRARFQAGRPLSPVERGTLERLRAQARALTYGGASGAESGDSFKLAEPARRDDSDLYRAFLTFRAAPSNGAPANRPANTATDIVGADTERYDRNTPVIPAAKRPGLVTIQHRGSPSRDSVFSRALRKLKRLAGYDW